jgi:hypothetical protein
MRPNFFPLSMQAIQIEGRLVNVKNPADTYINACAVLSQLGKHQTALEHAQQALIMLQEELLSPEQNTEARAAPQVQYHYSNTETN